jgi:hypothetical protein
MSPIPKSVLSILVCIMIAVSVTWFSGCKYYNEVDLYPQPSTCDTTNVTYSQTITPILRDNCYVCHSTSIASGGVILDTPEGVQVVATNGQLWKAVNHAAGVVPMPKDLPQLPACPLAQINKWITSGHPNN